MKHKVVKALNSKKRLIIKYNETERKVDPLYLFKYANRLYFVGHCYYRKERRIFKLSRIQFCQVLDEPIQTHLISFSQIDVGRFERNKIVVLQEVGNEIAETSKSSSTQQVHSSTKTKKEYPKKVFFKKMKTEGMCRSPLEEIVFKELDNDPAVDYFKVEPFKIPYKYYGHTHNYLPDVLVTYKNGRKELLEIKLSGDIFSPKNQAKFRAARTFAKEHNMHFIVRGVEGTSVSFQKSDVLDWEIAKEYKQSQTFPSKITTDHSRHQKKYPSNKIEITSNPVSKKEGGSWSWVIWVLVAFWILSSFAR